MSLYSPKFTKRYIIDLDGFIKTYGFSPAFFFTWKALIGDSGDNIPGVCGIGSVAATNLVKKYGNDTLTISLDDPYWQKNSRRFGGLPISEGASLSKI